MNQNQEIELKEGRSEEIEIDLFELFSFYLDKLRWIAAACIVGALIAGMYTYFAITPLYTATAKMYMVSAGSQSVVDLTDLNIGQSISKDYVELLKTRPIVESVIKDQDLPYNYNQLLGMLNLSVITDTRIICINATSADPKEAMNIANALAVKGVSELPKLMETPEPHIAEYAVVPQHKSSPSLTKNTMIGALIGLVIVLAIFTVQFLMDDTYKTADEIERDFGVMPLTVIPEGKIEGLREDTDDTSSAKKKRKKAKKKKYFSKSRRSSKSSSK
jgi:capsular polysaccharide biosynthesis protein